jgi:hypothetical protein
VGFWKEDPDDKRITVRNGDLAKKRKEKAYLKCETDLIYETRDRKKER